MTVIVGVKVAGFYDSPPGTHRCCACMCLTRDRPDLAAQRRAFPEQSAPGSARSIICTSWGSLISRPADRHSLFSC